MDEVRRREILEDEALRQQLRDEHELARRYGRWQTWWPLWLAVALAVVAFATGLIGCQVKVEPSASVTTLGGTV